MEIWNTHGAVKALTGIDPDEFDADTFVAQARDREILRSRGPATHAPSRAAQTGPYWLMALHYVNVWTLYLTPVYLAAIGTVLYFSWYPPQRDWVLLRYFIVLVRCPRSRYRGLPVHVERCAGGA